MTKLRAWHAGGKPLHWLPLPISLASSAESLLPPVHLSLETRDPSAGGYRRSRS